MTVTPPFRGTMPHTPGMTGKDDSRAPAADGRVDTALFFRRALWVAFACLLVSLMAWGFSQDYGWDTDHEMYFGGRLLHGELIWTREFHDKLPVVPLLFALPAATGSVITWNAISVAALAWAALLLWRSGQGVFLRDRATHEGRAGRLGAAAALLFIYLNIFLPASITGLNTFAGSLVCVATLLYLPAGTARPSRGRLVVLGLAATFLAAVAISVRPYYLLACLLIPIWSLLRAGTARSQGWALVTWTALWTLALGAWGLLLNLTPFLVAGDLGAFRRGLSMLSQDINPQGTLGVLREQAAVLMQSRDLVVLAAAASVILALLALARLWGRGGRVSASSGRALTADATFAAVLAPLALEVMFAGKHFHDHYFQLFAPYWAISALLLGGTLSRATQGKGTSIPRLAALALVVGAIVLLRTEIASTGRRLVDLAVGREHPFAADLAAFEGYLTERRAEGKPTDFLQPGGMYLHWKLDEPRHGFPHAANTQHIFKGWWSQAVIPAGFDFPTTPAAYCAKLDASGPSVVVEADDGSPVLACLSASRSYRLDRRLDLQGRGPDLLAYTRTP